jgi:hypothetical protein
VLWLDVTETIASTKYGADRDARVRRELELHCIPDGGTVTRGFVRVTTLVRHPGQDSHKKLGSAFFEARLVPPERDEGGGEGE